MYHPSGDILPGSACSEITSPLIIPRLQKLACAKLSLTDLSSVTMLPSVSNHIDQPFKDVCKLNEGVTQAHSADIKWILPLFNTDGDEYPLKWSGYMTTRDHHVTSPKPLTPFAFGPLIDASISPWYNSDNLGLLWKLLVEFGYECSTYITRYATVHGCNSSEVVRPRKMGNTCNAFRWDALCYVISRVYW